VDPVASLYLEPEGGGAPVHPPAVEAVDVFRIFREGGVETVALRGLSLRVEPGEMVAVVGPSGCGKSTFLHLAAGLDQPSAGEIRIAGRPLGRLDEDGLADVRARGLSLVFQNGNLWPDLSARENVRICARLAGVVGPAEHAAASLRALGLGDRLDVRAGSLSGGEQQRVAIAAAAARQTPLVLCDEPTGELDLQSEADVLGALGALAEAGAAVVVVTHSFAVADAAGRVIELRDGRVAG
jgi:ABC-type lipoprotein export system ATPase subunit